MNLPAVICGVTFEAAVINIISRTVFIGRQYQLSVQKVSLTSSVCIIVSILHVKRRLHYKIGENEQVTFQE